MDRFGWFGLTGKKNIPIPMYTPIIRINNTQNPLIMVSGHVFRISRVLYENIYTYRYTVLCIGRAAKMRIFMG